MAHPFHIPAGLCLLGIFLAVFFQQIVGNEVKSHMALPRQAPSPQVSGTAKTGPNILFIMSDDQGKSTLPSADYSMAQVLFAD